MHGTGKGSSMTTASELKQQKEMWFDFDESGTFPETSCVEKVLLLEGRREER